MMPAETTGSTHEKKTLESEKLFFEAMKHLTTLSTGSILLLVTFLEKIFREGRDWKILIGTSLVCFILSTLASVSSMLQSANFVKRTSPLPKLETVVKSFAHYFSLGSFLAGVSSLIAFALRNLYCN